MIDQHRIMNHNNQVCDYDSLSKSDNFKFEPRKATIVTVETTDVLILDHEISMARLQPILQEETEKRIKMTQSSTKGGYCLTDADLPDGENKVDLQLNIDFLQ